MRTIIAGSHLITDYVLLDKTMREIVWRPMVVLSGRALGERRAVENSVPLEYWPAKWRDYGKRAGMIRDVEMSLSAEALVALWDGNGRGTAPKTRGLLVAVFRQSGTDAK